jgi:hypothetical protein
MAGGLVTRTVGITSQGANGNTLSSTYVLTGNEEVNLSQTVPIGTNTEYDMAFPYANIQCVDIISTVAMTLKFNSSGAPAPQIVLAAGVIMHWDVAEYAQNNTKFPNPFGADVTKVYCTNVAQGQLDISVLLNTGP